MKLRTFNYILSIFLTWSVILCQTQYPCILKPSWFLVAKFTNGHEICCYNYLLLFDVTIWYVASYLAKPTEASFSQDHARHLLQLTFSHCILSTLFFAILSVSYKLESSVSGLLYSIHVWLKVSYLHPFNYVAI